MKKQEDILIKFIETDDAKKLDEILYNFEDNLNKYNQNYFIKETENPFIYFVEYPKPKELIEKMREHSEISKIIPVKCVFNNINHITTLISKKIKNKSTFNDTFNIKCFAESYISSEHHKEIENQLKENIKRTTNMHLSDNPTWNIEIHIIGEISAINIKHNYQKIN